MLRSLIDRARDEFRFWKACNLSPAGKRAEALALLAGISAHPQISARATLKSADILLISGNFPAAIARYGQFISNQSNNVEALDRHYLLTYATFFQQEGQRRISIANAPQVTRGVVMIAAKSASYTARNEFPPPEGPPVAS